MICVGYLGVTAALALDDWDRHIFEKSVVAINIRQVVVTCYRQNICKTFAKHSAEINIGLQELLCT